MRISEYERRLHDEGWETRFDGEVVSLVGGGAFVRFGDEGFEGFLPVRMLGGDWWALNEHATMLVGEHTGTRLRLGDPVEVQVRGVETARGRVDLVPAISSEDGEEGKAQGGARRRRHQ